MSTRVSLRFLPVPSPSLRPVPVGLSTSFLTPLPGSFSSPFHAYLLGIVLCLGCVFPVAGSVTFSSASSSVSSSFLPLPSPSFRPVLPSSLHSRPLRFSRRLPAHMAFRLFPFLLPDSGFRRRSLAARFLWPAGRAEAPPHHSREAARSTGTGGIHKPISNNPAVYWKQGSQTVNFHCISTLSELPETGHQPISALIIVGTPLRPHASG